MRVSELQSFHLLHYSSQALTEALAENMVVGEGRRREEGMREEGWVSAVRQDPGPTSLPTLHSSQRACIKY
jgi:hypothetical protein